MGLGAYSVVRYADDLADQRVNLGVIVWHPIDGYRCRLSPSVDKAQAIDPRLTIGSLKRQLEGIKEQISSSFTADKVLLDQLARDFRHGLVVSSPYPAKISSADEALDRLYELLVSPTAEIRRAGSQKQFASSLKKVIETSLQSGWPRGRIQELGVLHVGGIPVNVGMRTMLTQSSRAALWHPLSFQSETKPEAQLATAKATVLDIFKTREIDTYTRDKQYVAVQSPKTKSSAKFGEVISCLKHGADRVFVANDSITLMSYVQQGLRALEDGKGQRRAH
jgi:Protein of unknown function (DUF3037)